MKPQTFLKAPMSLIFCSILLSGSAFAADTATAPAASHVSLWVLLKAGGVTMIVLGLLSVVALTMIFYNFLTIKLELIAPPEFTDNLIMRLESGDLQGARIICDKKKNMISSITMAGINRASRGKTVIREAVGKAMNKEISKHWRAVAFLGDIASVAPLLGLLGTVIGMIQAFNVISTAGADLKPIMLVGGISKALITTAAGLVIAIPALGFYSYFRGIIQEIFDVVDDYCTDITKLIEEAAVLAPVAAPKAQAGLQSPFLNSLGTDNVNVNQEALFHA
jgi:biopolymer transport protein ExbB